MTIEPRPNTIYLVSIEYNNIPNNPRNNLWITWFKKIERNIKDIKFSEWQWMSDYNFCINTHVEYKPDSPHHAGWLGYARNIKILKKIKEDPTKEDWNRIIKDPKYRLLAVI